MIAFRANGNDATEASAMSPRSLGGPGHKSGKKVGNQVRQDAHDDNGFIVCRGRAKVRR